MGEAVLVYVQIQCISSATQYANTRYPMYSLPQPDQQIISNQMEMCREMDSLCV